MPAPLFTPKELSRVGIAVTMMAVCGTIIIVAQIMMLGHYNSLAHALPKAMLDGGVIALLLGRRGRWRCLALLGVVYGLVLLLQIGVAYLVPVMAMAGAIAAISGASVGAFNRRAGVVVAAILYELLAGFGAPIKIYFGTDGQSEPFVWGLWFAEWPLRIAGAAVGVMLAGRWRRSSDTALPGPATGLVDESIADGRPESKSGRLQSPVSNVHSPISDPAVRRADMNPGGEKVLLTPARLHIPGVRHAALCVLASIVACIAPMYFDSWLALSCVAGWYLVYALAARMRVGLLGAVVGLLWGWVVFSIASYAWHQDLSRAGDLLRTVVLRFFPLAAASSVLVSTVRPVDLLRLLRQLRLGAIIILPLARVVRSIPDSRREFRASMDRLKRSGQWNGTSSFLRRPIPILRAILLPQLHRWASQLTHGEERNERL